MSAVRQFSTTRPTGALLLREAIAAHKQGSHSKARFLLDMAARESPRNEFVWLWRAFLAKSRTAAQEYVEEVLRINPNTEKALEWYAKLQPMPASPPKANWECPLCLHESRAASTQCPEYRGIVQLNDLNAFLTNDGLRRDQIRGAIERIRSAPTGGTESDSQLHLAIAHLNLLQSNQALIHLKQAFTSSPGDKEIGNAVRELRARKQVMVVDDSPTIRTAVSEILERHRYRSVAAEHGLDALARLNEEIPDLIILDIRMPKMDGYQVCKVLKANQQTRHVPVIMLSASLIDKVRGRMVGAVEFISKPFRTQELLKLLDRHMRNSGYQPYTLLRV